MTSGSDGPRANAAADSMGGGDGLRLLSALVALAPTNLEDPVHRRWEKPNYPRTVDLLTRTARSWGLATRIYDPVGDGSSTADLRGVPRPNLIVDLDAGAEERVLVLAHYDVVPVPAEQLGRWHSPPHILTHRSNGRLYGRGSNDDLGSGVVASLLAMRRLAEEGFRRKNVRLLVCCDEETGGEGGIEALKAHDERLPPNDPERFITGEVALIPDGSPHATAGSSGVVFMDATFSGLVPLESALDYGEALVGLHDRATTWRSRFPSPDWPDHGAPQPVITGRVTVTKFDLESAGTRASIPQLMLAHAETDAANQIAESVTLVFSGEGTALTSLPGKLSSLLPPPFLLSLEVRSSLTISPGTLAVQVVGQSAHGGYPHRGHNPVPAAFVLLRAAASQGWLDGGAPSTSSFAVDLRLTPEMPLEEGVREALGWVEAWIASHGSPARIDAPLARRRGGYCLPLDDPTVLRLAQILLQELGVSGVFGEYGGTDASSLSSVLTPAGKPLPAIVFGSMDREAHIHEAEESVDPRMLGRVSESIYRYVNDP